MYTPIDITLRKLYIFLFLFCFLVTDIKQFLMVLGRLNYAPVYLQDEPTCMRIELCSDLKPAQGMAVHLTSQSEGRHCVFMSSQLK